MKAIFFDLDDTLVDTSRTFDEVVFQLVDRHAGEPCSRDELFALRAGGGYNDDWDSVVELLRRREIAIRREQVEVEGLELYLKIAPGNEDLMIDLQLLSDLGQKCPLFIVTGRVEAEYEPIWAKTLSPYFKQVVCRDTFPELRPKPAPDQIQRLKDLWKIESGWFVGNSVDDMRAGKGAGLQAIGVCTNQTAETLIEAGADTTWDSPAEIRRLLELLPN